MTESARWENEKIEGRLQLQASYGQMTDLGAENIKLWESP